MKFPSKGTPEREELIEVLKNIGKLDEVTDLDVYALAKVVKSEEWDEKELKKIEGFETKEKNYRLGIRKK